MNQKKSNQSGFSLLEVLIALLILSIGLLGIAGLQVTSKRTNFEAIQRTTATMLALEMIERMRANAGELDLYTNTGAGRTFDIGTAGVTGTDQDCDSTDCTAVELADYDLWQWQEAISGVAEQTAGGVDAGGLVAPTACITGTAVDATADVESSDVAIAIAWRGMVKLGDPTISTCGQNDADYADGGTQNVFRRVLIINASITELK